MRLKEKKLLQKFAATLKKFSALGAKKVEYGNSNYKIARPLNVRRSGENLWSALSIWISIAFYETSIYWLAPKSS